MKKIHTPMKSSIGTHCRKIAYQGLESGGFTAMRTPRSRSILIEVRIVDDVGALGLRAVLEVVRDVVAADHHGFDAALLDGLQELREVRLLLPALLRALEDGEEQDDDEADHHPEGEILVDLIHRDRL